MIMVLGIQAHGDDDFVPSFSVKLLFVAYFQLKAGYGSANLTQKVFCHFFFLPAHTSL